MGAMAPAYWTPAGMGSAQRSQVGGMGEMGGRGVMGVTSREGVAGKGWGAEGVRAPGGDDEAVNGHLGQVKETRGNGLAALGAGVVSTGGVGSGREGGGHRVILLWLALNL